MCMTMSMSMCYSMWRCGYWSRQGCGVGDGNGHVDVHPVRVFWQMTRLDIETFYLACRRYDGARGRWGWMRFWALCGSMRGILVIYMNTRPFSLPVSVLAISFCTVDLTLSLPLSAAFAYAEWEWVCGCFGCMREHAFVCVCASVQPQTKVRLREHIMANDRLAKSQWTFVTELQNAQCLRPSMADTVAAR